MSADRLLALALGLGGALSALVFVATLEPLAGLGVFAAALIAALVWRAPVRSTYLVLMTLALAVEDPAERPFAGEWRSPWAGLGDVLFGGLHKLTHLPFLRVSGLELGVVALVALVLVRRAGRLAVDPPPLSSPTPLRQALTLAFAAVLALEAWGVARGGDVKQSLFQMRALLFTVLIAHLGLVALRGPKDAAVLGRLLVLVAVWRAALGAFFAYAIARPRGLAPAYVTTHSDTVLFSLALLVLLARWWEAPSARRLVELALLGSVVLLGVSLNDRRLAWVTLLGGALAMVLVSPWNRAKRFAARAAVLALPPLLAYVTAGWNSSASVFAPVHAVRSIVAPAASLALTEEESSTEFRALENFNLVQTWRGHLLLGTGFGHPYEEAVTLPDISRFMPDYRFHPHNQALFLWSIGGLVGFTAMFLYLAVTAFFAVRGYHAAVRPEERAMMAAGLAAVIAYLNQLYGDMGGSSYTSAMTLGPLVALVGQVAVSSGGWVEGRRP